LRTGTPPQPAAVRPSGQPGIGALSLDKLNRLERQVGFGLRRAARESHGRGDRTHDHRRQYDRGSRAGPAGEAASQHQPCTGDQHREPQPLAEVTARPQYSQGIGKTIEDVAYYDNPWETWAYKAEGPTPSGHHGGDYSWA